jgi:hypothetical protein
VLDPIRVLINNHNRINDIVALDEESKTKMGMESEEII